MSNVYRESVASGNLFFKRYELAVARQCSKAFTISRSFSVLLGEIQKKDLRYKNMKIIKGMVKIKWKQEEKNYQKNLLKRKEQ